MPESNQKPGQRVIFHVDVNSAFLSWESVRRLKEGKSDLRKIPAAISGSMEKRTSVILAKSIPAKKYGVKTGEPLSRALKKCPELYIAKPDFNLYLQSSDNFIKICRGYSPIVEKYSIDECFIDMTGTGSLYKEPVDTAVRLKNHIKEALGFTVNIGVSSNKLLAKMASDFEKPDKVHTLYPEEIEQKLWNLPAGALFGVGRKTAERLSNANIHTIGDLATSNPEYIEVLCGKKFGRTIYAYANGIDDSPVHASPEDVKGYSVSSTTEEDLTDFEEAGIFITALSESVTSRIRRDQVKAGCVCVTIRDREFIDRSHQAKLKEATDITDEVIGVANRLLRELWDGKTPLRLIGLALTDIRSGSEEQLSFFDDEGRRKSRLSDQAVDAVNDRFGQGAVTRASLIDNRVDVAKKYKARMEKRRKG